MSGSPTSLLGRQRASAAADEREMSEEFSDSIDLEMRPGCSPSESDRKLAETNHTNPQQGDPDDQSVESVLEGSFAESSVTSENISHSTSGGSLQGILIESNRSIGSSVDDDDLIDNAEENIINTQNGSSSRFATNIGQAEEGNTKNRSKAKSSKLGLDSERLLTNTREGDHRMNNPLVGTSQRLKQQRKISESSARKNNDEDVSQKLGASGSQALLIKNRVSSDSQTGNNLNMLRTNVKKPAFERTYRGNPNNPCAITGKRPELKFQTNFKKENLVAYGSLDGGGRTGLFSLRPQLQTYEDDPPGRSSPVSVNWKHSTGRFKNAQLVANSDDGDDDFAADSDSDDAVGNRFLPDSDEEDEGNQFLPTEQSATHGDKNVPTERERRNTSVSNATASPKEPTTGSSTSKVSKNQVAKFSEGRRRRTPSDGVDNKIKNFSEGRHFRHSDAPSEADSSDDAVKKSPEFEEFMRSIPLDMKAAIADDDKVDMSELMKTMALNKDGRDQNQAQLPAGFGSGSKSKKQPQGNSRASRISTLGGNLDQDHDDCANSSSWPALSPLPGVQIEFNFIGFFR